MLAVALTEVAPLSTNDGGYAGKGGRGHHWRAVKVTIPPSTGSTALLAVTVTASGLGKGVAAHCLDYGPCRWRAKMNPWLERVWGWASRAALRGAVRRDAANHGACAIAALTGQGGHGLGVSP